LCPYCGDTLPCEHGGRMRFLKRKAQLLPGQVQAEPVDTAVFAAPDSKPLQSNSFRLHLLLMNAKCGMLILTT
jgi:hypothetical protein